MNLTLYEKALGDALANPLQGMRFTRDDAVFFSRRNALGKDLLRFGGRLQAGRCLMSGTAGVLLDEMNGILGAEPGSIQPIITVPFHFLHDTRDFFEWTMTSVAEAGRVAEDIMVEVRTYALPFFAKYSQREAIRRCLQSSDPNDWFALNAEQRIGLLAALEYKSGNIEKAKGILDEAIAQRLAEPEKYRRPLERLRARLPK